MRCEQVQDLLPLHALGQLEPAEARDVRGHLDSGCPRCASEAAAFQETLAALPLALESAEPSPMAKARLMARVRKEAPAGRPASPWRARAGWIAAAAAVLIALVNAAAMSGSYREASESLRAQIRSQSLELARLKEQVQRTQDTIQMVSSPGAKVIDLAGQEDVTAAARVFYDSRRGNWKLYADNLPPAGAGKTYQLWVVTAQAKISAGVFDTAAAAEASGTVTVPESAGAVVALAVTPEPEGGSPQPTGAILLVGKI
ncbi:MAG: anti-sigma factor [Candidatus Polarisedimenticolia bacterium]